MYDITIMPCAPGQVERVQLTLQGIGARHSHLSGSGSGGACSADSNVIRHW